MYFEGRTAHAIAGMGGATAIVCHHEWQLGDLLIWDNTGTMHRVLPYALDSGRMMYRTTLVGEERVA
jgi:alpha-ketoglutarate-dependent taurine dioxygenase